MDAIFQALNKFYTSFWFKLIITAVIIFIVYSVARGVYKRVCRAMISMIEYKREFSSDGVYEGDSVVLTETLHNKSPFPVFIVDIWGYIFNDLRIEGMEFDKNKAMQPFAGRFRMIMPFMQLKRRHNVTCVKRGHYLLEGVEMLVSESHRYVESKAEIYVYPAPRKVPASPETSSQLQGDSFSRSWLMRDPFNISGVRDYASGDPFSSINFKATAKAGGISGRGIKVNNCDFVSNRTVMIYINMQPDPDAPVPTRIYNGIVERFLGCTTGLLIDAEAAGYRAGLSANCVNTDNTNSLVFPVYSGEVHFREIMTALSLVRPAYGVSFPGLLDKDILSGLTGCDIYVFALYSDDATEARLSILRQMGNTVNTFIFTGDDDGIEE